MQPTATTRASISPGLFELFILFFICLTVIGCLIFFAGKMCRKKRNVIVIGFLSGFIVNSVLAIYYWVNGYGWNDPFDKLAEVLSVLGWPDFVLSIVSFAVFPFVGIAIALIVLVIRKNRVDVNRSNTKTQRLSDYSTQRYQDTETPSSAKKQRRLAAELKSRNNDAQ
jgi:hypothetical protein